MSERTDEEDFGVLSEPATLTIQRRLPVSMEGMWAYLVESKLRRQWLADGEMEMRVGSQVEFVWRNDGLTNPPGERPPGFAAEHRMISHVTELDPPRKLGISWGSTAGVSFELKPDGNEVLLTVIHRGVPGRAMLLTVSSGWHRHLDILSARVTGREPGPFWDGWRSLRAGYDRRLPS